MWSVLNSVCRFFGVFEIGLKNLKSSWLEKAPGLQLNLNKQSNKTHIVGLNLKEKPFLIQYWIEIGQLHFKAHESAQFPEKMRAVLSGTHYLSWGEFFLSCFHWSRIQLFSWRVGRRSLNDKGCVWFHLWNLHVCLLLCFPLSDSPSGQCIPAYSRGLNLCPEYTENWHHFISGQRGGQETSTNQGGRGKQEDNFIFLMNSSLDLSLKGFLLNVGCPLLLNKFWYPDCVWSTISRFFKMYQADGDGIRGMV